MSNNILYSIISLALFLAGAWLSHRFFNNKSEEKTNINSTVLLERVREVCQLVTVQGEFNETYRETNLRDVTLYLPIPTHWEFSKEALLQVKGKVLVGYDMKQVSITIDSAEQKITLSNLPYPDILAIDHSIKYLDLEESFFNGFSPDDYTQLNKNAKEILREKAYQSDLLSQAKDQGIHLLGAMNFMANGIDWEVVYELPKEELLESANTIKH